jgi:hypothetical protein
MARYLVEEEGAAGEPNESRGPFEGLAVAKALAQKRVRQGGGTIIVKNSETGEEVARFESTSPDRPSLANSVKRMRAANDRLKEALLPLAQGSRGKKS